MNNEFNLSLREVLLNYSRIDNNVTPPDLTLHHFNLGYGIILDYHWPISNSSLISAAFIILFIIVLKKWKNQLDREEHLKTLQKEKEEKDGSKGNKGDNK